MKIKMKMLKNVQTFHSLPERDNKARHFEQIRAHHTNPDKEPLLETSKLNASSR